MSRLHKAELTSRRRILRSWGY